MFQSPPVAFGAGEDLVDYYLSSESNHVVSVFDIDGDGIDDITSICLKGNSILVYSLLEGQHTDIYLNHSNVIRNISYADILPDPDYELIVWCVNEKGCIVYIFANILRIYGMDALVDSIFFENGEDTIPPEGWDGVYDFCDSYDINGDAYPDLIFKIVTGWDMYPRELFAYDLRNRQRLWTYETANSIEIVRLVDLNNNGTPEVVLTGQGPKNGAVKGNQTDDRCRLMIVDIQDGQELWRYDFDKGSRDCRAEFSPAKNDSIHELFIAVNYIFSEKPVIGKTKHAELFRFDLVERKVLNRTVIKGNVELMECYNFKNIPAIEIAVILKDGTFNIYDSDFNFLRGRVFSWGPEFMSVEDLNGDDYPNYLFTTSDSRMLIFDYGLNVKVTYSDLSFLRLADIFIAGKSLLKEQRRLIVNGILVPDWEENRTFDIPEIPPYTWLERLKWLISKHKEIIGILTIFSILLVWISFLRLSNKKSRSFYNTVINDSNYGILHINNGQLIRANRKAEMFLGLDFRKIKNKTTVTLFNAPGLTDLANLIKDIREVSAEDYSCVNVTVDGIIKELEIRALAIKSKEGCPVEYLLFISQPDISKKEWLTLARGIAHDIKNPSGLASTQLSNLSAELNNSSDFTEVAEKINSANANIKRSLNRVSMFAGIVKELDIKPERTDINKYLRDYTMIRKVSMPKSITLKFEPGLSVPEIEIDHQYFASALDNLLDNAIDAISSKNSGAIALSSDVDVVPFKVESGERLIKCVSISIADTGSGISEQNLPSIFKLNFSTKKSKGLGMGLYQIKRIVEEHGGKIEVDSYEGEGTTFTIYIPAGKQ